MKVNVLIPWKMPTNQQQKSLMEWKACSILQERERGGLLRTKLQVPLNCD